MRATYFSGIGEPSDRTPWSGATDSKSTGSLAVSLISCSYCWLRMRMSAVARAIVVVMLVFYDWMFKRKKEGDPR
jgi:hypothetical protein